MLLKTRFYLPPMRPQCVIRQGLLDALDQTQGGELMLISAPAGYGKTTLVSQWLHQKPHTFSWLSLDKSHNSPRLFWQYAITALRQIQPALGQDADALATDKTLSAQEHIVIALLNDLDDLSIMNHSDKPVSLILDDFHLIESTTVLKSMNLFLDHLPPGLRVVMTSRTEPPLELARRRGSSQLRTITSEQLRFTLPESETFFNQTLNLNVPADVITHYYQTTEGWITGLQLISYSVHNQQGTASPPKMSPQYPGLDRHIADYLFEEVFCNLSTEFQNFLLSTALPRRFCAGLCNAMAGTHDALYQIKTLERDNLFIFPLDNYRVWFRLHDLFRQFLLQRLAILTDQEMQSRAQQGVDWLQQAGHYEDALALSIRITDWDRTEALLELLTQLSETQGLSDDAVRLLASVSLASVEPYPKLAATINQYCGASNGPEANIPSEASPYSNLQLSEPLTRRETQVLELMSKGLGNKAIADSLFISLNTLKVHIRNLYSKFGVDNRTKLLLKLNLQ
ncbi:hypothetical protein OLMES_5364 [Oleiphilus messinensis]|uniref:HTH luxR-type domain-containing protein n=1 Tax=Oleiphilus messinensis TaxID=141451 RepID=A0A1Y0IIX9_9GAMM|nr:LuxR family transcriptional regulator [Oleiphilus messinensis]ARU59344.1 hypothetical protein OLMES_5364 [Oleiphilus messinensis]